MMEGWASSWKRSRFKVPAMFQQGARWRINGAVPELHCCAVACQPVKHHLRAARHCSRRRQRSATQRSASRSQALWRRGRSMDCWNQQRALQQAADGGCSITSATG